MAQSYLPSPPALIKRLLSMLDNPEVHRLVRDIISCTVAWDEPQRCDQEIQGGQALELFPCLSLYFRRHRWEVRGTLYRHLRTPGSPDIHHLVRLEVAGHRLYLRLRPIQTTLFLSPFHSRMLSMLFGRLLLHHLSHVDDGPGTLRFYTPFSLEEQVVGSYLESLEWAPCATIKLDPQDNPYVGALLHSPNDLRRCTLPGSSREEELIRVWRLMKELLYYSIEGQRLFTGFAFLPPDRDLEYYRQCFPSLLLYHKHHHLPLTQGVEPIKQVLVNADGRNTFLVVHGEQLVGLLELPQGTHRQLTTTKAWREALTLATISHRGWVNFWIALKGRQNPKITLSLLELRHGRLHIPLFQDIFWQELEHQLQAVCPVTPSPACLERLKNLLLLIRRTGRGAILILGLDTNNLESSDLPLGNEIRLEAPVPLEDRWLRHFVGLAKSDGALVFNNHFEAVMFRTRLKTHTLHLSQEKDDLGSGIRHQVTREFTAAIPQVVGLCVSQDGHISLYRHGRLVSRLY